MWRSDGVLLARTVARRSRCTRRQVGCIITDLRSVCALGWNDGICTGVKHQCGCVHAERMALDNLDNLYRNLWLHCTLSPCVACAELIIAQGNICAVTFDVAHSVTTGIQLLQKSGINAELYERCSDS